MPIRPQTHRPRSLTQRDYAEEEAHRQASPVLALAAKLRRSKRWQQLRLSQLQRFPLCADPYGTHRQWRQVRLAQEVDHIVAIRRAPQLAFVQTNLQSLCVPCHARKTAQENREERQR